MSEFSDMRIFSAAIRNKKLAQSHSDSADEWKEFAEGETKAALSWKRRAMELNTEAISLRARLDASVFLLRKYEEEIAWLNGKLEKLTGEKQVYKSPSQDMVFREQVIKKQTNLSASNLIRKFGGTPVENVFGEVYPEKLLDADSLKKFHKDVFAGVNDVTGLKITPSDKISEIDDAWSNVAKPK